jgi:hypothetical protein
MYGRAATLACLWCLFTCGPGDVDGERTVNYYVRNDTTVTVSLRAIMPDTVLVFPGIAPAQRAQVATSSAFGEVDMEFFYFTSAHILQGDTVLDTYLAGDTARDPHLGSANDYVETYHTDSYSERTFALFSH